MLAPPETHLFRWADQHHGIPDVLVKGIGDYKIAERRGIESGVADAWRAGFDANILPPDVRRLYERLSATP